MRLIFTLLVLSTYLFAGAQNQTMDVYKLETAPMIDGDVTDWDEVWNVLGLTKEGSKTFNSNTMFQIAYDNDYFYLIVAVDDATPYSNTGQAWMDDCIGVFLSVDTTDADIDKANYPIQFRLSRDGVELTDQGVNLDVSQQSTATGYVVELAIPWAGLFESQGEEFTSADDITDLRFALQTADNTDGTTSGRTQQRYWNAALGGNSGSRKNYGYLKLRGFEPDNKTLDFHSRSTPPTIDGDFLDWGFKDYVAITQTRVGNSTFDCDARFKISYDADNFYFITWVQDKTPNNTSGQPWNDDCIEVYISADTSDAKVVDPFKTQLRFARDMGAITDRGIDIDYVSVSTDDGYYIEGAIPWLGLYESQGEEFTSIEDVTHLRFEIQAADNTDGTTSGRTQTLYWNNPDGGNSGSRENYGFLVLTENISTVSKYTQELSNVKAYYNYNQDALFVSGYKGELKIYDLSGQLLKKEYVSDTNSSIGLSNIMPGMYILSGERFVTKFVK